MATAERMPQEDDLAEYVEEPWRLFLIALLSITVDNCRWLQAAAAGKGRKWTAGSSGSFKKRLSCAAVSWAWVFSEYKSDLGFREVCAELGVEEGYVRRRILADCENRKDINQLALRAIREMLS
jgi:hypothetical protein